MKILKNKNIKSFIHMLAAYKKQHIVAMIFSVFYSIFIQSKWSCFKSGYHMCGSCFVDIYK